MTINSRLSRLEALARQNRPLTDREAFDLGVASLEQCERLYSADISRIRARIVGEIPARAAMEHAGLGPGWWDWRATSFPPDRRLTDEAARPGADNLRTFEQWRPPPPGKAGPDEDWRKHWEHWADAAAFLMVQGGADGMGLRTEIWEQSDGVWDFAAHVWAAAERKTISRHSVGPYHSIGMPWLCDHSQGPSPSGFALCYFSPADVVRHLGIPKFPVICP